MIRVVLILVGALAGSSAIIQTIRLIRRYFVRKRMTWKARHRFYAPGGGSHWRSYKSHRDRYDQDMAGIVTDMQLVDSPGGEV